MKKMNPFTSRVFGSRVFAGKVFSTSSQGRSWFWWGITLGAAIVLFYFLYLGIWSFVGVGRYFDAIFIIAILLALGQVAWHWTLIRDRTREGCFQAFRINHWLGFTVFAGIALATLTK